MANASQKGEEAWEEALFYKARCLAKLKKYEEALREMETMRTHAKFRSIAYERFLLCWRALLTMTSDGPNTLYSVLGVTREVSVREEEEEEEDRY